jgi:5-bromo-4-chloroindolyl phosphate hydrolysis protein
VDCVSGAVCTGLFRQLRLDTGGDLMAREFGGKFSPNGSTAAATTAKPAKIKGGIRAKLMFFAPLPLVFTGFGQITSGNTTGILRDFGAFAVLILAAWMLREGQKAEAAFNARASASRPALPRKILAALLSGAGVGVASLGGGLAFSGVLVGLTITLHLVAFGLDPLKNKGLDGFGSLPNKRVARAIDAAEEHITTMLAAMDRLKDRKLAKQLDGFVASARAMFRTVEDDPRDLTAARKYLSVYLMGASDATVKFVDLYEKTNDASARTDYEALLADLQKNFEAQRKELLLDDRSDLDVEIEVLRARLRSEGVKT